MFAEPPNNHDPNWFRGLLILLILLIGYILILEVTNLFFS
jgi:hypothetical protein